MYDAVFVYDTHLATARLLSLRLYSILLPLHITVFSGAIALVQLEDPSVLRLPSFNPP